MPGTLILVESPNKAKKISQFLPKSYVVRATVGHICDLPRKDYGVDLQTFEETYELRNSKLVAELRRLVPKFDHVFLATDPDREGEAIAWHVARELQLPLDVENRIEFNQVTQSAVLAAVGAPKRLDLQKVDAARSRRILDRIVGFDVSSEICWPAGAKSAGRVQTPALHILCERERTILDFVPRVYFTLTCDYAEGFSAFVPQDVEDEPDADQDSDEVSSPGPRRKPREFTTKQEADTLLAEAKGHPHVVENVASDAVLKQPEKPYTTSTLLQDASRKLQLTAGQAAGHAQSLFEAGYITYHRTDSTRVSDEAVAMAREYIGKEHPKALPATPPKQRGRAGAQDAHEAIRPTHLEGDTSPPSATGDLYAMIKARFLASQCKPAVFQRTSINIRSGSVPWIAEGSVLTDPGYLVYWRPYARQTDELLPTVSGGQTLSPDEFSVNEKKTSPPPRFDTGGLIKKLESSGVGRPSTFPTIVQTLLDRGYASEETGKRGKKLLQPTKFGLDVDGLLTDAFPDLVSETYTASMEASLDQIADGPDLSRVSYLQSWYSSFREEMADALPRSAAYRKEHGLKAAPGGGGGEETDTTCDRCGSATYRKIARKKGKGNFLACPECGMTRNIRAKLKPEGCKKCGSALIEKKSRKGSAFWGCVRFGADDSPCNYTEREDGSAGGRYIRKPYDKKCPKCTQGSLVILEPRDPSFGHAFYACEEENCSFTLDVGARVRRAPCPECGHLVLERFKRPTKTQKARNEKGDSFWSCARFPDCRYAQDLKED